VLRKNDKVIKNNKQPLISFRN